MSIAVKSGLPSLGSTEGAVITKDDISVTEETSPSASAGEDLPRGKSAYEVAVENGFSGTETEWLASLKGATGAPGADGKDGTDGKTPYVGDNGNWYIGADDTGKPSRGEKGEKGEKGEPGMDGVTPTFGIESVETGKPGTDAEVTMTGDAPNHGLRFVIPRGDKGDKGDTDISLGLTSAAVGQIIKVKAIDASGKPTAWEAADMQSGGGTSEEFILLAEVTLEEDVKKVTLPLSSPTKHFITRMWCPKTSATSNPRYISIGINGSRVNLLYYLSGDLPSKDNKSQCTVEAHGLNDGNWAISAYTNLGDAEGALSNYNQRAMIPIGVKNNGIMQAESVVFDVVTNDATQYFPVGSILRVWGV